MEVLKAFIKAIAIVAAMVAVMYFGLFFPIIMFSEIGRWIVVCWFLAVLVITIFHLILLCKEEMENRYRTWLVNTGTAFWNW